MRRHWQARRHGPEWRTARVGPRGAVRITNTATVTGANVKAVHARAAIRVMPAPSVTG